MKMFNITTTIKHDFHLCHQYHKLSLSITWARFHICLCITEGIGKIPWCMCRMLIHAVCTRSARQIGFDVLNIWALIIILPICISLLVCKFNPRICMTLSCGLFSLCGEKNVFIKSSAWTDTKVKWNLSTAHSLMVEIVCFNSHYPFFSHRIMKMLQASILSLCQ